MQKWNMLIMKLGLSPFLFIIYFFFMFSLPLEKIYDFGLPPHLFLTPNKRIQIQFSIK